MSEILIYGATGYTGRLVVERAMQLGMKPILAARNEAAVSALATEHGFDWRAFRLRGDVAGQLAGIGTVLHLAGPFSETSAPMAEACLQAGVHYIDITGEIEVFEALAAKDADAKAAGVVLLPGAGFDVVPSDCLAAHVKRRLPEANSLDIVIGGFGSVSRGTAKTMAQAIGHGTRVRENGVIVELDELPRGTADFGNGLKPTIGMSWGDVSTAFYSTSIPNIRVFFQTSPDKERAMSGSRLFRWFGATRLGQYFIRRKIDNRPPGPTAEMRAKNHTVLIAHAANADGKSVSSQLETPDGYTLTAQTALEVARRVNANEVSPGFHTPSSAFGPDFVLSFRGVTRRDLP